MSCTEKASELGSIAKLIERLLAKPDGIPPLTQSKIHVKMDQHVRSLRKLLRESGCDVKI